MNTPPSSAHIADSDIDRFARRTLPASAIVPLTDHLAGCADCRRRLARHFDPDAAFGSLTGRWEEWGGHVPESDVHAFVDGRLDPARREEIRRHLHACEACGAEVRDLESSASTQRGYGSRVPRWRYAAMAAAAMLALAIAIPGLIRRDADPRRAPAAVAGRSEPGTITERPGSDPLQDLTPEEAERVRRTLRSGRLSVPLHVQQLTERRGTLRGPTSASGFEVVGPVGTAVLEDRPTLRWTAAAAGASYIVTIQDEVTGATISSPILRLLEWTPEAPLARGRTHVWQVASTFAGREMVTPAPPAPPAKLYVVSAADAARAARLPDSPLTRGILYAELGLLDDAERALTAASALTDQADVSGTLLAQLRALRPSDSPSPVR